MILDKFFQLMAEKQARTSSSPPAPDPHQDPGQHSAGQQRVMLPDMIEKIAFELMSPDQIQDLRATMEMNLSFGIPRSATSGSMSSRQRGSIGMVVRFILGNIPALEAWGCPRCSRADHGESAA